MEKIKIEFTQKVSFILRVLVWLKTFKSTFQLVHGTTTHLAPLFQIVSSLNLHHKIFSVCVWVRVFFRFLNFFRWRSGDHTHILSKFHQVRLEAYSIICKYGIKTNITKKTTTLK